MTNYGWTNEDGEPIMSGEAYRFEQALDAQSAEERYMDDDQFFGSDDEYVCDGCGAEDEEDCTCDEDQDYYQGGEDAWLDGSYEE